MRVEHFFSDMDSTLLGSDGSVPKGNINAIKGIEIPFSLVSARAPLEMDFAIDALALKGPQVGFNGGIIYTGTGKNRQIIAKRPIQTDVARSMIEAICSKFPNVSTSFYDADNWYARQIDQGIDLETKITGQQPKIVDFKTLLESPVEVFKIMMIVFDEEIMQQLMRYFDDNPDRTVAVQRSGKNYLEVTHVDAVKANGVKYILAQENVAVENTYAFGDGHNDIPMFKLVGHAVAMSNAMDDVKEYAETITDTNDNAGVGVFIDNLLKNTDHS